MRSLRRRDDLAVNEVLGGRMSLTKHRGVIMFLLIRKPGTGPWVERVTIGVGANEGGVMSCCTTK